MNDDNLVKFSTVYAKREFGGINAAIVLQKLAWLQEQENRRAKHNTIAGLTGYWFYCPIRHHDCKKAANKEYRPLSVYFPWLSPSALYDIVQELKTNGLLNIATRDQGTNKAWYDNTLWYQVPEHVCQGLRRSGRNDKRAMWLKPADAVALRSASAAVVLNWFRNEKLLRDPKKLKRMTQKESSNKLPMSPETFRRLLDKLVEHKYLRVDTNDPYRDYTLCEHCREVYDPTNPPARIRVKYGVTVGVPDEVMDMEQVQFIYDNILASNRCQPSLGKEVALVF